MKSQLLEALSRTTYEQAVPHPNSNPTVLRPDPPSFNI